MRSWIFLFLCISLRVYAGAAERTAPPPIEAVRTARAIHVDGVLNEDLWQNAGYTALRQRIPMEGAEPTMKTEVWVAYDDDALYVAARMHDPAPDSIVARLSRRDENAESDLFVFAVDSYHDKRTAHYFGLSAAGAYSDGTYQNDEWADEAWDGIWEGKAHIDRDGWTVEMRIPFSQLRFHNADDQVWGFDVNRYISRRKESDYITYTPADGSGMVSRFIELRGLHGIPTPARVEILPYATAKAEFLQHAPGDPFNTGSRFTPGIGGDIKLGIGSNLTLDGTVNPDFGQVEIDPAVINLSDQETFFWEKRPFFLEGTNVFRFGNGGGNSFPNYSYFDPMYFNSRRIGRAPEGHVTQSYDYLDAPGASRILGAAKLTGQFPGDHSVGFVQAVTSPMYADLATGDARSRQEIEPLTSYTAARVRKEYAGGRQSIGVLGTAVVRAFDDDVMRAQLPGNEYVAGVDGWTFLDADNMWVLTGYVSGSWLTGSPASMVAVQSNSRHYYGRPDATHVHIDSAATSLDGYTARFWLNKQKGNVVINAAFGVQTPGLDMNGLGLSYKADVINGHIQGTYRWTEPGAVVRSAHVGGFFYQSVNFEGINTARGVDASGYVQFVNYTGIAASASYNLPTLSDTKTRGGPLMEIPGSPSVYTSYSSDERQTFAYDIAVNAYRNPEMPVSWGISGDAGWKVTQALDIELSPSYNVSHTNAQYVTTISDAAATATYAHRYIFAITDQKTLAASIRVNWTFTPDLSLQCYIQPYIVTGIYSDIKELAKPSTYTFNHYGQDGGTITRVDGNYTIDPDGAGPAAAFTIGNPDFNYRSFRLNAVLRWEYLPGSTLYLVWTQSRAATQLYDGLDFERDNRLMFGAPPDNIFLLKMSYWLHA